MLIYLLVTGGALHMTSKLFKIDDISFGRSLLTAFALQVGVPVAMLVSKLVVGVDRRSGVAMFFATIVAVQVGVVAWLFRTDIKKTLGVWLVGVFIPLMMFGLVISRSVKDKKAPPETSLEMKTLEEVTNEGEGTR